MYAIILFTFNNTRSFVHIE